MADSFANSYDASQPNMVVEPLVLQAASGDPSIVYTGQQFRQLITAMFPVAGVLTPTSFKVTQRGAGANFSVDIAAGFAAIALSSVPHEGTVVVSTTGTVNLPTPTAPGSGTWHHRIVAQALEKNSSGSLNGWRFWLRADPGSGLPALPVDAIDIAQLNVPSSASSITNSMIVKTSLVVGPQPFYFCEADFNPASTYVNTPGSDTLVGSDWTAVNDAAHMWTAGTPSFMTIPYSGVWDLDFVVGFDATTGTICDAKILVNGTTNGNCIIDDSQQSSVTGGDHWSHAHRTLALNAGDIVYFNVWSSGNATVHGLLNNVPSNCTASFKGPLR